MMCPDCNVVMEKDEVDLDGMTDGQQANYMAGFYDVTCPKCGRSAEVEDHHST